MTSNVNSAPSRLLTYLQQNLNYRCFIGYPLANPRLWIQIINFSKNKLFSEQEEFNIKDVHSFIITYPSGEILDSELVFEPLPQGTYYIKYEEKRKSEILIPEHLDVGNKILKISHKKEIHERRKGYYSTTLINLSQHKVKVTKFSAYSYYKGMYVLSTITGGYFNEQQFNEWYNIDRDGWIKSGQTVKDPNNYGSENTYWVYFFINEIGQKFVAGGLFEKQRSWWNFL